MREGEARWPLMMERKNSLAKGGTKQQKRGSERQKNRDPVAMARVRGYLILTLERGESDLWSRLRNGEESGK